MTSTNDELGMYAMQLASTSTLPLALKVAIRLDVLEIIAKAGPGAHLSSAQIASHFPTHNPDAPIILDHILGLLASYSVLTWSIIEGNDGSPQRFYGLSPVCVSWQSLGKDVCHLFRSATVLQLYCLLLYMISYEMEPDVDMLTPSILYRILSELNGRLVLHMYSYGFILWVIKFFQEVSQPYSFADCC
ncbi:hypothetical protein MRB53_026833 [Persea americana]|uniref:Uncharacterized protein n=1 Tax=Persea americana TaxID=3435 RepID=A0ACC2LK77_PERAE|nr:hypothetical protein MRB53_026833 [Persea americana]